MSNRTDLMTLEEFGRAVRMSKDWVGKACRMGVLKHATMGTGSERKRRLVYASEIDRLMRERTQDANDEFHRIAKARTRRQLPPVLQRF